MSPAGRLKSFGKVHPVRIIRGITNAKKTRENNDQCDEKANGEIDVSKWVAVHRIFFYSAIIFIIPLLPPFAPACGRQEGRVGGFGRQVPHPAKAGQAGSRGTIQITLPFREAPSLIHIESADRDTGRSHPLKN
jgi:hypothetical protein